MNYLVIPDVHNKTGWAEAVAARYPDYTKVFLGDYFDSFNDTPAAAKATAEWLRWSLYQPDRIHLMGNHDLPYRRAVSFNMCPGWTREKHRAVECVMNRGDWGRVGLIHLVNRPGRLLILSHAGLTLANIYGVSDPKDVAAGGRLSYLGDRTPNEHLQEIVAQSGKCLHALFVGGDHHWLNQGERMGKKEAAGPFWVDRHYFKPIVGIDQIMGHTHVDEPTRRCIPNAAKELTSCWFIDGGGRFAALIEDGNIIPIHATPGKIGQPRL